MTFTGPKPRPKNWLSRFFSPRIEESLRLRVLALASLWTACLGLAWVGGDLWPSLVGGGLGSLGYWLGWRWRHRRSLARPLLIAAGVIALSFFMRSQMLGALNGNWLPIGHFLVLVQGLASFDSRTRASLYTALILSGTALFFASQQAFEPNFGIFIVAFVVVLLAFLTLTFLEDGFRDARVHWAHHRPARPAMLPYWIGVACMVFVLSGLAFWLMPRGELNLVGRTELVVLPYSGESMGRGYEPPEFSPAGLISLRGLEDADTLSLNETPDDTGGQGPEGSEARVRRGARARTTGGEMSQGTSAGGGYAAGPILLDALGGKPDRSDGGDAVFFVRTKVTSYWRGRTLEYFDGQSWRTDIIPKNLVPSSTQPGVWFDRDNLRRGRRALYQQTFYVQQDALDAILTGYSALSVEALDGSLGRAGVQRGATYRVLSAYPRHSSERLRRDSTWTARDHLVGLPAGSERNFILLADRITGGAASDFEKVERIVNYLRLEGSFDDGWPEELTATAQLDGFLFEGRPGDAMDYATATAMLARASGLPARVAAGYLPGARDPLSGAYKVKRTDAHAWAEIYFADHGWVPFDSSPRSNLLSGGETSYRLGFLLQAGVGDAVFGAAKSAPTQFVSTALKLLSNPAFYVAAPLILLLVIVLRWLRARPAKRRVRLKGALAYNARLSGEDRRELLRLYGKLEKLLRRRSGIRREPWRTVAGFTALANPVDPGIQSHLTWFTRAVWHAAYDPKGLPSGLVEEAQARLRRISTALRSGGKAAPLPQA